MVSIIPARVLRLGGPDSPPGLEVTHWKASRMEPFVSVVTPFYNTAAYLPQCIESVLGQSYRNFEYVLVDNCSSDDSLAIATKYAAADSRIRIVNNSEFLGQVANYNH